MTKREFCELMAAGHKQAFQNLESIAENLPTNSPSLKPI